MSNDSDIMRILGNIEGKLDGIAATQEENKSRIDALHLDLQEHKSATLRDRERVLGGLWVIGSFMTTIWAAVTFFKDTVIMFLTGKGGV